MGYAHQKPVCQNQSFDPLSREELERQSLMSVDPLRLYGCDPFSGDVPGLYPGMDILDESKRFKGLQAGKRPGAVSGVVLHRTNDPTAEKTKTSYEDRIQGGSHIGAHYLIGEDGAISLTVPTDEVVYHSAGNNNSAIGIEHTGVANKLDPKRDLHEQVAALNVSPRLKQRLLALTPAQLKATMADNGGLLYGDISGKQKRSSWNLLNKLSEEHGLDLSAQVHAHEDLNAKTIGEGENIGEFVEEMLGYPSKIAALEEKEKELQATPGADPQQLQLLQAVLQQEQDTQAALAVDGTTQEHNALDGEAILEQPGPATERERLRTNFFDNFYQRVERLERLAQ